MKTIRLIIFRSSFFTGLILLLNACTTWLPEAHHIEIQQGNVIKQEARDRLQAGMSKQNVRTILGNPVLQDPYHPNRWDYIYRIKSDKKGEKASRLTLFFKDNKLIKIDDTDFVAITERTSLDSTTRSDDINPGSEQLHKR